MRTTSCLIFGLIFILGHGCISTHATKNNKCVTDIEIGDVPGFGFEINKDAITEVYLTGTLFKGYTTAKIFEDVNQMTTNQHDYLEFSKHHNPDVHLRKFSDKINRYTFLNRNGNYILQSAVVQFLGTEAEPNFRIAKDSESVTIGMEKRVFAKYFGVDTALCDTVSVHNDTDRSWYIFKNEKLDKILIENYIH